MKFLGRVPPAIPLVLALAALGAGAVHAQLEGGERGVPPVDSTSTFEVTGVEVDVGGANAEAARLEGWRLAQRDGWRLLWSRTHGRPVGEAPNLPDSVLNSIVSGILIEQEQIGPTRYIARLGVLFDRARTGQMLGVAGLSRRSAPMLVIPVMVTGGSAQSFESRNEWQRAWARFRTAASPVDYVRPVGSGIDPLLLNIHQAHRRGRAWWRMLLDQYGAADIVVPEVQLKRLYPGGPAIGIFSAYHGPDNELLDRFTLQVADGANIPRMLDEGVRRLDAAFTRALEEGRLRPDPTLIVERPEVVAPPPPARIEEPVVERPQPPAAPIPLGAATAFSIQVDTPSPASVQRAEIGVSGVPGVTSALTTSLALGGTSVMRVTYVGDAATLAAQLQARGWQAQVLGPNTLRITRPGGAE